MVTIKIRGKWSEHLDTWQWVCYSPVSYHTVFTLHTNPRRSLYHVSPLQQSCGWRSGSSVDVYLNISAVDFSGSFMCIRPESMVWLNLGMSVLWCLECHQRMKQRKFANSASWSSGFILEPQTLKVKWVCFNPRRSSGMLIHKTFSKKQWVDTAGKTAGRLSGQHNCRCLKESLRNGVTFLLVPDVTVEQCSLGGVVKLEELEN